MYFIKRFFTMLLAVMLIMSCKEKTSEEQIQEQSFELNLPEWAKDAVIYEANVRQMTEEGNFKALEAELPRLDEMGIDIIWLMPIHPISMKNRKATNEIFVREIEDLSEREKYLGSPYAVADYMKVNPDYGTMADFKSLLARTHELGMKLIIDWVPNHTGWDHPWITEHPDWYTQDSTGKIIDPIDPSTGKSWGWVDVADLNYDNKEMRQEMIRQMQYWLEDIGIDGFRVDVAHGVPQDFWDEASPQLLESKSDIFLLAESAVPSNLNNQTFHADYGWSFHHLINEIAKGEKHASEIFQWLEEDRQTFRHGIHMHFTSNHDENTWAGTVFERMGEAHKVMAVLCATFEGIPLIYSGMEEPMRKRLAFFMKDYIGFKDYAYADFYRTLFELKENNRALWNGDYGAPVEKFMDHTDVLAYSRERDGDKLLCLLNLSDQDQEIQLAQDIAMNDVFLNETVNWEKGTSIKLVPWSYYVLSNK